MAPNPALTFADDQLLIEINARGRIDEEGTFIKFTRKTWLEKWQTFRERHPEYHEHLIDPAPEILARWHREEALRHQPTSQFAYHWHLKRWAALSDSADAADRIRAGGLE